MIFGAGGTGTTAFTAFSTFRPTIYQTGARIPRSHSGDGSPAWRPESR